MSEDLRAEVAALRAEKHALEQQLQAYQQRLHEAEAEQQATTAHYQQAWQQLTFLLENLPLATIVWDAEFRVQRWSPQAEKMFGWQATEVVGKTMYDWPFIFEADVDQVTVHAQTLLRTGGSGICQNRNYRKDGQIIYCEWFSSVLLDEAGELVLFLSLTQDISDLKRLEAALRTQAQREKTLNSVIRSIRNSLDLNHIFQTTVTEIGKFLQVDYVIVHELNEDRKLWQPIAEYRQESSLFSFFELDIPDLNNSIAVQLKKGHLVCINDATVLEDEVNRQISALLPAAWLIMPIQVDAYPLTTIALVKRGKDRIWSEAEIELATAIADQLAVAMQQAVLLQDLQSELKQRQKAEQALQQLNQSLAAEVQAQTMRLQVALAAVKMGIWEWDTTTNRDYWSPETYEILGLQTDDRGYILNSAGEVIDTHAHPELFFRYVHPDDRDHVKQVEAESLAQKTPFEVECRLLLDDGQMRWVYERGACTFNEQGEAIKMVGIIMDVSDRKQAEQALQESEARYRAIVEDQTEMIARFAADSTMIFANEAYYRYFGLSPENLIGKSYNPVIYEADRERISQELKVLSVEQPTVVTENRVYNAQGEIRWTQWVNRLLPNASGDMVEIQSVGRDIHQLKETEIQLRQVRDRLQYLLTHCPAAIFTCEPSGSYVTTYISENITEILGYHSRQFLEDPNFWVDHIHPDDREAIFSRIPKIFEHGFHQHEFRFLHADGTYHWLYERLNLIRDEHGQPLEFIGYLIDISDRKAIEEQLRRTEERFRIAQELSLDAFTLLECVRDEQGKIIDFVWTYANPKACEILKQPLDNLIGHRLLAVLPGNRENSELFERYVKVVETGQPHDIELLYESEGIMGWFRNMTVKLEDGIAIFFSDITERKQTEAALRKSEARLKEAQRVAHVGDWEFDVLTGEITWSDEVFRIFGWSPTGPAPTYEQLSQSFPPEERERHDRIVAQILATGEPYDEDFPINRPDGSIAWMSVKGHAVKDEQGQVVRLFGTTMDISDRKATETKLQQAIEELEQLNRLKDDFLSTVSHELRTPITNMKLSLRMLDISMAQPESPQRNQKIAQYLTVLNRECEREINLINDLLDLQRLEAGKHQGEVQVLCVNDWLSEFIHPFQERANARQQALRVDCVTLDQDSTLTCEVDSLERVVSELINNACKYTPPEHAIVITSRMTDDRWHLSVTNYGVEISSGELPKIFERFYRIPSHDPWKQGGTGLGLALVKKLVEYLGGTIQVESGGNQTSFHLSLPRSPITKPPLSSPDAKN